MNLTGSQDSSHPQNISKFWRYGALVIFIVCFSIFIFVTVKTYGYVGPPIPGKVVDETGSVLFTHDDIISGQKVFLEYGLMDNGTLWGHGAYLGPDFSAEYLHQEAVDAANYLSESMFNAPESGLTKTQKQTVRSQVMSLLTENRYDHEKNTLQLTKPEVISFNSQIDKWGIYFASPQINKGLPSILIKSHDDLRSLTSFFAWAAWACSARIPGKDFSYTNNFPYEPLVGNGPSEASVLWSGISLVVLLAGLGIVLLAFGKFNFLGWHESRKELIPQIIPSPGPVQRSIIKFFFAASLLFLAQALAGGVLAHYVAEPGSFYGFNLSDYVPTNVFRSWHLQLAIFWIATCFMGGGLFLSSIMTENKSKKPVIFINILFVALVLVVAGSLAGELLGVRDLLGKVWYWFGNQGWEYLEIGRAWQFGLMLGFVIWVSLLVYFAKPALKNPELREITLLFLGAALSIPLFYLPAFFFNSATHFTIVETWRFWIIHLWVEGFFELFATIMIAVLFHRLGMVSRATATRVIYLDAILFLGSGILGTGHHWYWTGQSVTSMAISATFSALEVVPLVLITLDASAFYNLTKKKGAEGGDPIGQKYKWTFFFLIAVGAWNFIGAGIFGFLINLPVINYYEVGTNLTANHSHGALMGVFGMLAAALWVFALREVSSDENWKRIGKFVSVSFWGLNIGLAGMLLITLFPSGIIQLADVVTNGYWHARSIAFTGSKSMSMFGWIRLPADFVFIVFGILPLCTATFLTMIYSHKDASMKRKLTA